MGSFDAATWQGLATSEVSDALDSLGIPGAAFGIRQIAPSGERLCGLAFTVRYAPAADPPGTVGDFLDDVPEGSVVVLDNGGRVDCTVWGGLMSIAAQRRRIAGTVISGACRDTETARRIGYPLFARGSFMRTGKDRVQFEDAGVTVSIGGIRVSPGDLLIGDDDGVVVVPDARRNEVLERALATHEVEGRIAARLADGESLSEARAAEGYHRLQRLR